MNKHDIKEILRKEILQVTNRDIVDAEANLFCDIFGIEIIDLLVVFSNINRKMGINIFDIFKEIKVDDFTVNSISEIIESRI